LCVNGEESTQKPPEAKKSESCVKWCIGGICGCKDAFITVISVMADCKRVTDLQSEAEELKN